MLTEACSELWWLELKLCTEEQKMGTTRKSGCKTVIRALATASLYYSLRTNGELLAVSKSPDSFLQPIPAAFPGAISGILYLLEESDASYYHGTSVVPILDCHHTWCCCGTPSDFYCATQT
ncbi:hypothetical protein STEG23_016273, partial [Scotinomys teguina]